MLFQVNSIPKYILDQLTVSTPTIESAPPIYIPSVKSVLNSSLSCQTCQCDADDKSHFRSDFHRYNLKRRLKAQSPILEEEFEEIEEMSSIEGSDDEEDKEKVASEGSPLVTFRYTQDAIEKTLMVYKLVMHCKSKDNVDYNQALVTLQSAPKMWTVFMMASGHFSGAIIDASNGKAVKHKTFHRYTTRRKQGGAQSSNDKSKGKAKSAGAGIRRYNEQALQEEIMELLLEWKDDIQKSSLVFVRAPVAMRGHVFFDKTILDGNDIRVRGIPFITKRPTLTELMRCTEKLLSPIIDLYREEQAVSMAEVAVKSAVVQTHLVAELETKCEASMDERTARLVEYIKKGRLDALKSFVSFEDHNRQLSAQVGTMLHVAAMSNQPEIVTFLLQVGNDPSIEGAGGKRPYDLAESKDTRDAFRRFRAKEMERYDYQLANIPAPLTAEMESKIKEKEKERRKKEKERKKTQVKAVLPEPVVLVKGPTKKSGFVLRKTDSEGIGMSPEQRMRLDREKRAMAADLRLKAAKGTQ